MLHIINTYIVPKRVPSAGIKPVTYWLDSCRSIYWAKSTLKNSLGYLVLTEQWKSYPSELYKNYTAISLICNKRYLLNINTFMEKGATPCEYCKKILFAITCISPPNTCFTRNLRLHDTITHNHKCCLMWQLLKKVRHFMKTVSPFPGGKHGLTKV